MNSHQIAIEYVHFIGIAKRALVQKNLLCHLTDLLKVGNTIHISTQLWGYINSQYTYLDGLHIILGSDTQYMS